MEVNECFPGSWLGQSVEENPVSLWTMVCVGGTATDRSHRGGGWALWRVVVQRIGVKSREKIEFTKGKKEGAKEDIPPESRQSPPPPSRPGGGQIGVGGGWGGGGVCNAVG